MTQYLKLSCRAVSAAHPGKDLIESRRTWLNIHPPGLFFGSIVFDNFRQRTRRWSPCTNSGHGRPNFSAFENLSPLESIREQGELY